jgi:hypothetical protein
MLVPDRRLDEISPFQPRCMDSPPRDGERMRQFFMPSQVTSRDSSGTLDWNWHSLALRHRACALAGFGLANAALDIVSNELHVQDGTLVIVWPAAGLLLVALFLAPPRLWVWLLAVQLSIGVLVTYQLAQLSDPVGR